MLTINKELCNGCRACVWVCPHGVLAMNSKTAIISFEERCIECGACELNCEPKAVTVTKGTGCLVAIIKEDVLGFKAQGCGCG